MKTERPDPASDASSEVIAHLRAAARRAGVSVARFAAPAPRHVTLRGMRFHYLDWGTEGRRPILFLHGGGLTAHTWDLVCLALRDEFRCLALDQRGHGDSEWSPEADYSIEAHRGDVEAFVERLGLEAPVVVGMSMGGLNALAYAGRAARPLAALVVVDVGPEVRPEGARRIAAFASGTGEFDSLEDAVARASSFNPKRDPALLRRSLLHNLRRLPSGTWTWKYDRRRRPDSEEAARQRLALWADVSRIECPVLVVRGAESDVFLDADADALARALPRGEWVRIEGAGHTVQGDNPRDLVAAVRLFLARQGIGDGSPP